MRGSIALLASLTLLAACGNEPEPPQPPEPPQAPAAPTAPDAPMPVEPDGGIGDGAAPLDEALAANSIPTRFQGVWDYEGGTCARESDMRMEISDKDILFYESIGTLTAVKAEGDDVVLSLDMEGEGETWLQLLRLSIDGEGEAERLSTSDGSAPKQADEYPSKRCAS